MELPLDTFIPHPDIRERFSTTIEAPASVVMDAATNLDMQSLIVVRVIFWLREKLLGAGPSAPRKPQGILAETRRLGWGLLAEQPDHLMVCGAVCQPWLAKSGFIPIPAERFAAYSEPKLVKVAWTLEAESLGPARTRFSHETRAEATDDEARMRFRRYWRWARFGIITIRLFMMPEIRRIAERRWAAERERRV